MPWYINDSGKRHYEVPDSISRDDDDAVLEYLKKARSVGDELFAANEAATKNSIQELQNKDQPFTNVVHGANVVAGSVINTLVKPMWEYISKDVPSYLDVLNRFQKGELDGASAEEAITGLMTGVAGTSMAGNRPAAESAIGMFVNATKKTGRSADSLEKEYQDIFSKHWDPDEQLHTIDRRDVEKQQWAKSGVFMGRDGKWRAEISDEGAGFFPEHIDELRRDYLEEEIDSEDFARTFEIPKVKNGRTVHQLVNTPKLGDIFDHEELYKHYPDIKDMPIEVYGEHPMGEATLGEAYHPRKLGDPDYIPGYELGKIKLYGQDPETLRSTLLHEIQHQIQFREHWAEGGDAKVKKYLLQHLDFDTAEYMSAIFDKLNKIEIYPTALEGKIGVGNSPINLSAKLKALFPVKRLTDNTGMLEPVKITTEMQDFLEKYQIHDGELYNYINQLRGTLATRNKINTAYINGKKEGYEWYRSIYGEMEARNTQFRDKMKIQENPKYPPHESMKDMDTWAGRRDGIDPYRDPVIIIKEHEE